MSSKDDRKVLVSYSQPTITQKLAIADLCWLTSARVFTTARKQDFGLSASSQVHQWLGSCIVLFNSNSNFFAKPVTLPLLRCASSSYRTHCSPQGSAGATEPSAGGQFAFRDYSRPRQMQAPEPPRTLLSPSARKRQFMEQKRAELEARRKRESLQASAEPTKVSGQMCAAIAVLHTMLLNITQIQERQGMSGTLISPFAGRPLQLQLSGSTRLITQALSPKTMQDGA